MEIFFLYLLIMKSFSLISASWWSSWEIEPKSCPPLCIKKEVKMRHCIGPDKCLGLHKIATVMTCVGDECDLKLSLNGSSAYVFQGNPFTLMCKLHSDNLVPMRQNAIHLFVKTSNTAFVTWLQEEDSCSVYTYPPSGYTVTCGMGTDLETAKERIYELKIERTKSHDEGLWWCEFKENVIRSKTFQLKILDLNTTGLADKLNSFSKQLDSSDINIILQVVDAIDDLHMYPVVEPDTADKAFSAVSRLMHIDDAVLHDLQNKRKTSTLIVQAVEGLLGRVILNNSSFKYADDHLAAASLKYNTTQLDDLLMAKMFTHSSKNNSMVVLQTNNSSRIDHNTFNTIVLPRSLFESLNVQHEENCTVAFTAYQDDVFFFDPKIAENSPNESMTVQINSEILGATIHDREIRNMSEHVLISFVHTIQESDSPRCVFWSYNEYTDSWAWSSDGCTVVRKAELFTICGCHHLTHFALIMNVYPQSRMLSEINEKVLTYLSYIGCFVSMVALFFTVLTYTMFSKLRQDTPSKILVNLCLALLGMNFIFVFGMQEYTFRNEVACQIVAAAMHYFLLSAICWMAVEAVNMYFSLIIVFMTQIQDLVTKYVFFGWGLPLIIVGITAFYNNGDSYALLEKQICWIKNPTFYFAFLAPVSIIMVLNCIVFVLVIRQIIGMSGRVKLDQSSKEKIRYQLHGAVIVIVLLGLTYLFAVFAFNSATVIFYYLFTIFNSLQGLFIFMFYCIFKKDSRNAWKRLIKSCLSTKPSTSEFNSQGTEN